MILFKIDKKNSNIGVYYAPLVGILLPGMIISDIKYGRVY